MPILNLFKKIDDTCLSSKLHLWGRNPSLSDYPDLVSSLKTSRTLYRMEWELKGFKSSLSIPEWYASTKLPKKFPADTPEDCYLEEAAKFMIEISIDYDFDKVSIEQQKNHPLIDRSLEIDPVFKIFHFFHFMDFSDNPPKQFRSAFNKIKQFSPLSVPYWIAPCKKLWLDMDHMNWVPPSSPENFQTLIIWGKILDDFLQTEDDFKLFYYLLDALYDTVYDWNEFKFLQLFSLIELFLSKRRTSEINDKLLQFLPPYLDDSTKKKMIQLLHQIRNKIAHGDFKNLESSLLNYYEQFLSSPDKFDPDYGEYSLRNWVLIRICSQLQYILRCIILLMLFDKNKLSAIRNA